MVSRVCPQLDDVRVGVGLDFVRDCVGFSFRCLCKFGRLKLPVEWKKEEGRRGISFYFVIRLNILVKGFLTKKM